MKNIKKIFALLLIVTLCMLLAVACESDKPNETSDRNSNITDTTTPGSVDTSDTTTEVLHEHAPITDIAVAATCTTAGKTAGTHCFVCGEVIVAQTEIPALGHTEVIDAAVEPTCGKNGKTEGSHCSVCNTVLKKQTEIPTAIPHTVVIDAAVEGTCSKNGKTEGSHCSVCNTVIKPQTTTSAKPHTEVIDSGIDATCVSDGKTEGKHCSVCKAVIVSQSKIPATGVHTFDFDHKCISCDLQLYPTEGLEFKLADDKKSYIVIGIGSAWSDEIIIPLTYNKLPVTAIGDEAFDFCTQITSVTILSNITSIGNNAFEDCRALKNVDIPNSIKYIGQGAFNGCHELTSVTIPGSVTEISAGTFKNCWKLSNVTIENGVTSIDEDAFDECSKLTSVTIPNSVTSIGSMAFSNCYSLTNIEIPDSVIFFGASVFYQSSKIKMNEYDNGYYIGNEKNPYLILLKTESLNTKSLKVHGNTKVIASGACSSRAWLTSVTLPNGLKAIGSSGFAGCQRITSLDIPNSVEYIGSYAFSNCYSLTGISIPNILTGIEAGTFSNCLDLTSITIPRNVVNIGDMAFYKCTSLTTISIPDTVTYIGASAFSECTNLKKNKFDTAYYIGNSDNPYLILLHAVTTAIPSCNVHADTKFIASDAFNGCKSLTSIAMPRGVTSIGEKILNYANRSQTSISFDGTIAEWISVYKDSNWNDSDSYNAQKFTVICTDGKLDSDGNIIG